MHIMFHLRLFCVFKDTEKPMFIGCFAISSSNFLRNFNTFEKCVFPCVFAYFCKTAPAMNETTNISQPSPATRAALLAILKTDPGISPAHRAEILAAFDRKAAPPPAADLAPVSAVARDLGLYVPTVLRWIERGVVQGHRQGERLTLVSRAEVAAYVAANPPRKGRRAATPQAD